MSSAKTIADILSFSELVDGKSFIGNPFTSQPMYIAACAFLMESAYYSSPSSRPTSPPPQPLLTNQSSGFVMPSMVSSNGSERKSTAKHILLASAARENYQRCYKALKALNTYWEGTRYILTVLDQKAKGIVDPLLYTAEDMENASERGSAPPFSSSGWIGNSESAQGSERPPAVADISSDGKWSPKIDPGQGKSNHPFRETSSLIYRSAAIGWALTGATNSAQPNLSLLYQMRNTQEETPSDKPAYASQYSHSYPTLPGQASSGQSANSQFPRPPNPPRTHDESRSSASASTAKYPSAPSRTLNTNSPYYMGLGSSYVEPSSPAATRPQPYNPDLPSSQMESHSSAFTFPGSSSTADQHAPAAQMGSQGSELHPNVSTNAGAMMIESHDVDMNSLQQQDAFPLSHDEILPWLEYLPQDVLSFFGEHQNFLMSPDDGTPRAAP